MEEVTTSELTLYDTVQHHVYTGEHHVDTVEPDLDTVERDLISDFTDETYVLCIPAADPPGAVTSDTDTSVVPQVTTAAVPNVTAAVSDVAASVPNDTAAVPKLTSRSVHSSSPVHCSSSLSPSLLKTTVPAAVDGIVSVY